MASMIRGAGSRRRRQVALIAALALILGAAGTAASGAWFTSSTSASGSISGALLPIGNIGQTSDQKTIAVADVYPMTDAQAATGAKSEWITVRNTGTIPA
jgi:Tfp pilus assembly protein PilN